MRHDWHSNFRRCFLSACVLLAGAVGTTQAQDNPLELRQLLEQQAQQIQALKQRLDATETHDVVADPEKIGDAGVRKIVADYLKEQDDKKKATDAAKKEEEECAGYKVGTKLGVTASFNDIGNLWFRTANNDFTMHPGYWMQYDNVWWPAQSNSLKLARNGGAGRLPTATLGGGVNSGGIGDLEDGTYFRRIRPFVEGTFWENYEYRLIIAAENDQFFTAGLDEFWVGVNKIPLIGTIRVGHVKDSMGFEGDMSASSRCMTFMERSCYSAALEEEQNFVTGIWFQNAFFNQHMTYNATMSRIDNGGQATGAFFGDGQYAAGLRMTFLPWYENGGRDWLHLGAALNWRNGVANNGVVTQPGVTAPRVFQLRSRQELRDDDPAGNGGGFNAAPSGPLQLPNANSNRLVDTGLLAGRDQFILGTELCWVRGPFSLQAEYGWNWVRDVVGVPTANGANQLPVVPFVGGGTHDFVFSGGYVQLAYTLTGEARGYDRARGTLSRQYFGGPQFTNMWLLRRECGGLTCGWGAVEVAGRYSYVNLNDGTGRDRIQGGIMQGFTGGINWYLNPNLTLMFDYIHDLRDETPVGNGSATSGNGVTFPGSVNGIGIRAQLSF